MVLTYLCPLSVSLPSVPAPKTQCIHKNLKARNRNCPGCQKSYGKTDRTPTCLHLCWLAVGSVCACVVRSLLVAGWSEEFPPPPSRSYLLPLHSTAHRLNFLASFRSARSCHRVHVRMGVGHAIGRQQLLCLVCFDFFFFHLHGRRNGGGVGRRVTGVAGLAAQHAGLEELHKEAAKHRQVIEARVNLRRRA